MKRIALFVLTNLAILSVLGVVASLLGVNRYLTANGLNLGSCWRFALVVGLRRRDHLAADLASRWPSGRPARR